jgi:hypothetical protein
MSSVNLSQLRAGYQPGSIRNVPEDVRWHLLREAEEATATISDTILRALGDFYGLDVVLTGRTYRTPDARRSADQFGFDAPPRIKEAIWRDASRRKVTESAVVVGILAQRYGVEYVPPRRGRPPKAPL